MFTVRVVGDDRMRELARDVRRAGTGIAPRVTAELRKPVKGLGEAIRGRILAADLPAAGRNPANRFPKLGSRGLRRPTAMAVTWSVRLTGSTPRAAVLFDPLRIPTRIRPLFKYWVGQRWRLRHPIPNTNRRAWIQQRIPKVWRDVRPLAEIAQRAAGRVLDESADIIGGRK